MVSSCLSVAPDAYTNSRLSFGQKEASFLLQNCVDFRQLKQIHARIIRSGLSQDELLVRKLIHLCSSHAKLDYAALLFNQIQRPLTFTWNLMIRAYAINGFPSKALALYNLMVVRGVQADKFTFPFVIRGCTASLEIVLGRAVHGQAIKSVFSEDVFVQNTLLDLYFKCGDVCCGSKLFEKMKYRNEVSWTTMVAGLAACGDVDAARRVFDKLPARNVVAWTAMMNGYVRMQRPEEAFDLFWRMQLENVKPNEYTLVNLLKACTELGSLRLGKRVHDFALKNGFELGVYLGTALVDMYSKCGSLEDARKVFDEMQTRSLATWNSMITSLGVHGFGEEALSLFAQMEEENVMPDAITFVGVLCACVHTCNLEEGCRYFKQMTEDYGIDPILEHYTCMVELYDRGDTLGVFCKIEEEMPVRQIDEMLALLRASCTSDKVLLTPVQELLPAEFAQRGLVSE